MAILRAGPYGNVSNGVITAHSDGGSGVYPVNCANKNWPNKNHFILRGSLHNGHSFLVFFSFSMHFI